MSTNALHLALEMIKLATLAGILVPLAVGLLRWAAWRRS